MCLPALNGLLVSRVNLISKVSPRAHTSESSGKITSQRSVEVGVSEYGIYRPLNLSPANKKTSIADIGSTSTEPTFLNHADTARPFPPSGTAFRPSTFVPTKLVATRFDDNMEFLLSTELGARTVIARTAATIEAIIRSPATITFSM